MDHNFAVENHTAERYLIGELTEPERDAYEEHFFCCTACAEEIKSASAFMESARRVIQDEMKSEVYGHAARHSIWGSWLNWRSVLQPLPAMACLLLIAVGGFAAYQNGVTIPRLTQMASAQVVTSEPFILRNSRAAVPELRVGRNESFILEFEIPPSQFSSYEASIITQSHIRKPLSRNISAQDAKKPLEIIVPAGTLGAGNYVLLIEGTDGTNKGEVNRFPFKLEFQD